MFLLAEEEYYFSDESVVFYPKEDSRPIKGRLKICSQSLFFDPHEERLPVVRYAFQDISVIEPWKNNAAINENYFMIRTSKITQMRANMLNEPYKIEEGDILHRFSLNWISLTEFLSRVMRLYNISKGPRWIAIDKIKEIVEEKEASTSFDTSWLEYLDERPLKEQNCVRVTPLVHNPGRLMITTKLVYFQPLNNITANPVEKFPFSKITRVIKRRHTLRHIGLEIFLEDDYQNRHSAFFAFRSETIRDSVFTLLTNQPGMTKLQHENQSQTLLKWRCGLISNFDYLMYLNSLADRTFNDLTQYPVFPWILADYKSNQLDLNNTASFRDLSKPVGALNPQRLAFFRKRYEEMESPKFLYGTHYSTPGYVLYYLVRVAPEYMLRLQNGKFDAPDRLFTNISSTWESVCTNSGDLKELIPEFFLPNCANFLLNSDDLRLGRKQDGTWVGDVTLPPWAKSHSDFIEMHRKALESDYVSNHLHHWIDLIFGDKQRGSNALKANNVFHPLTYEGEIDLDSIKDPIERDALIVQINEFGQTPKQIFTTPHPKKFTPEEAQKYLSSKTLLSKSNSSIVEGGDSVSKESLMFRANDFLSFESSRSSGWSRINTLKLTSAFKPHRSKVSGISLSQDGKIIYSVSHDSSLKLYDISNNRQLRSTKISNLALSSLSLSKIEKMAFVGSWDNNIYTYSTEYNRVVDTTYAHDDAVSSMINDDDLLVTGSWDSTVKVWKVRPSGVEKVPLADFVDHEAEVKCLDMNKERNLVASGGLDGKIHFSDIRSGSTVRQIQLHNKEVTCVKYTEDGRLITTGADNTLKLLDPQGIDSFNVDLGETFRCLVTNGDNLLLGGDRGLLRAFNLHSNQETGQIPSGQTSPITCISVDADANLVVTGTEEGGTMVYGLPG
uniref:BEACH domain-containing protein n=1 Tax=Arcella intermedia TaxID=1963864 RepID=A0A6B2KXN1_9EUKA